MRRGDVLGPVKERSLGESNDRLSARLLDKDLANAERTGLGRMLARIQAEADEQAEIDLRKGVCPDCHMVRSTGIARSKHECW